ncbi:MAG: FHA domain-containing protein, partial [Candidatus Accumulibacter sp.]|nr:FHA domain-containing protein [Accumulibacter sp.]
MNAANPFLSVLAVSISSNVHLHEKLESSEAAQAIDRCLKRVQRSVEAGGGRVARIGGGEVMAVFDAADAVVNAAIEMQQRIASLPPISGVRMSIRVGIACGALRSGQPLEDELAVQAAHLAGLAKPGQTLASAGIRKALPETMRALAADSRSTLANKPGRKEAVVEIVPGEAAGSPRQAADAGATGGSLRLHYGGNTLVLDEHKPVIDMGRNGTCDLVIGNPRASRQHAMIRRRGSLLVLVDSSTNGTYVTIDGHAEQFV